jgi:type IV secretory pathway VirB10-like protein
MNIVTSTFNVLINDALMAVNAITEPKDKVMALTSIANVLVKSGAVDAKEIFAQNKEKAEKQPKQTTAKEQEITREDLINKPEMKEEPAPQPAKPEAKEESKPESKEAPKQAAPEEAPRAEDLVEDVWNEQQIKIHLNDYYLVSTIASLNSPQWNTWLNKILEKCSGGAIKEYVDENSVKPSVIRFVAATIRKSLAQKPEVLNQLEIKAKKAMQANTNKLSA